MRIFIFLLFTTLLSIPLSFSQTLRDFKKKTEENTKERTAMLDLLRTDIKNDLEQDVIFVVNHFKHFAFLKKLFTKEEKRKKHSFF